MDSLTIKEQSYPLPLYLPDATWAVVRGLDSRDLQAVGLKALMINSYHLRQQPGPAVLEQLQGIKNLMNWPGLLASDSGGFQLFSLIQKNPDLGKITDEGVVLYHGSKKRSKSIFTPEESIRLQFDLGSDIIICLDDFSPPQADADRIEESVKRTVSWAERARAEFDRQLQQRAYQPFNNKTRRPLLLAAIQGHKSQHWRQYCANKLLEIGFDLYGLGGWPFDPAGNFDYDYCRFNAQLTPDEFPRFALGVGRPENIVQLYFMGYQIFDCVLPTRDARHQRLYVWKTDPGQLDRAQLQHLAQQEQLGQIFDYLYIGRGLWAGDLQAISQYCDCPLCRLDKTGKAAVSRAYLHHLFKVGDAAAWRLATLHNLRHYSQLMEVLGRQPAKK